MPFAILIALFIAMPFVELSLLLKVHEYVGLRATLGLVVVTGIAGAWLARRQGAKVLRLIQQDLEAGRVPAPHILDGVMILAAGLLLITPGIISDCIGILLMIPLVRNEIRVWMRRALERRLRNGSLHISFGPWGGP